MKKHTLCDHVRRVVRRAFADGREFSLSVVYAVADTAAAEYPRHANRKVRCAVMRQMLQDEREPMGLVFVRPGVYHYPIVLDSFRERTVDRIMSYVAVVESLRAVAQSGRDGRKHVFDILEREGGVATLKQLDPAHYDQVNTAARKFLADRGVELDCSPSGARQANMRFFTRTNPCKRCGGVLYYASSGGCRTCALNRGKDTASVAAEPVVPQPKQPRKPVPPKQPKRPKPERGMGTDNAARQEAINSLKLTYHGPACEVCGGHEYFTKSMSCMACVMKRVKSK